MAITRINPPGGGKTSDLNFYLKASSLPPEEANGIKIIPRTFVGQGSMAGAGLNIFKDYPVAEPNMAIGTMPSSGNEFIYLEYNGNPGQADIATVTFDVILPANLNLNASRTLSFDAVFTCKAQGGTYNNQTDIGTTANALTFPVTILSALRTYFAGTALDFGEIGLVTSDFATKNTGNNNYVYVQSSGAYDIALSSQNGFVLQNINGVTGDNDKVKYSLDFLGATVDSVTSPTPGQTAITKNCIRAGLSSESKQLPIKATLMEAGAGKNPSNYMDTLTVTLTPKAYDESGMDQCGS